MSTVQSTSRGENKLSGGGNQQGHLHPAEDLQQYFLEYARERPDVVALWCFGIGFVLGWKLKPW